MTSLTLSLLESVSSVSEVFELSSIFCESVSSVLEFNSSGWKSLAASDTSLEGWDGKMNY